MQSGFEGYECWQDAIQPVVFSMYRRLLFDTLHGIPHPDIAGSLRLVSARFVWLTVNDDVRR